MSFVHACTSDSRPAPADGVIVLFQDRQLARLEEAEAVRFPTFADLATWETGRDAFVFVHVGRLDGGTCWFASCDAPPPEPPSGWAWLEARALLQGTTPAQAQAIACARQLQWWRSRHRFCGCCGSATVEVTHERARRCPQCGATFFPTASPAVIVAVTRGDHLLLGHNKSFRPGMFSLLAGFVDPGETFEQAAVREVREETGIEIGALRYVTSQPWPFPNSLMVGFRATHVAGEIVVDGHEIEEAGWFTRDALPDIPRRGTVARELIDAWVSERTG